MNHVGDVIIGFAALVIAASLVLYPDAPAPRPKPEQPAPVEQACDPKTCPPKVVRAEPQTDQEKIAADISDVRKDLAEIKETIRLQQTLKTLPNEPSGDQK